MAQPINSGDFLEVAICYGSLVMPRAKAIRLLELLSDAREIYHHRDPKTGELSRYLKPLTVAVHSVDTDLLTGKPS